MASILPGYEYDIFVSYRQNDNRSGWVSEFVKGLQEELASAIKYPVSVYFDSNPHDGLLETHSVDKTLEGKLKCLIFIPVISQTYCDPTSFAWGNEFLAFRNLACNDPYTLNVRLANGNMASRILPIRIHDLDHTDQTLFERESGGVLRAVDFIFSSPGVNRPLRSKDDDVKEITHELFYRDQINKVANAVRELLAGLKTSTSGADVGEKSIQPLGTTSTEGKVMLSHSSKIPAVTSQRKELRVVLLVSIIYLLSVVMILEYFKFVSRLQDSGHAFLLNSWIIATIIFLPLGPLLFFFMMPSKRSKVILAATVFSFLAVPIHMLSTDFMALTVLLIVGSVLYYFTIPPIALKRNKAIIGAVIFLGLAIVLHILFKEDDATALTILLILGPVLYYFLGQE